MHNFWKIMINSLEGAPSLTLGQRLANTAAVMKLCDITAVLIGGRHQRAMEITLAGGQAFGVLVRRAMTEYNIRPVVRQPGIINVTLPTGGATDRNP
jgi:hypothetical protein